MGIGEKKISDVHTNGFQDDRDGHVEAIMDFEDLVHATAPWLSPIGFPNELLPTY